MLELAGACELHEGLSTRTAAVTAAVSCVSSGPGQGLLCWQDVGPADSSCVTGQVRREKGQRSLDTFVRRPPGSEAQPGEKGHAQEYSAEADGYSPGKRCTWGSAGREATLVKGCRNRQAAAAADKSGPCAPGVCLPGAYWLCCMQPVAGRG